MEPPTILRIKRKRGQDPLQALVLEDSQLVKRSKPSSPISSGVATPIDEDARSNFYFKLTRTDALAPDDILVLNSILNEASGNTTPDKKGKRNFVIPKPQTQEDVEIPNELSDMVNNFVISDEKKGVQRKRRHHSQPAETSNEVTNESTTFTNEINKEQKNEPEKELDLNVADTEKDREDDEYVYDVYQLSPTAITTKNHPKSQIGYIKFFNDEDEFGSDDSYDRPIYSDNEDSNAEDYYQNDYPEDEDAEIDDDIHNDYKETELENDDINDLFDYVQQNNVSLVDNSDVDEDYIYEDEDDDDDDDYESDEEFERQQFFDDESEDELAMHRDRIFSRLQKMVDEAE